MQLQGLLRIAVFCQHDFEWDIRRSWWECIVRTHLGKTYWNIICWSSKVCWPTNWQLMKYTMIVKGLKLLVKDVIKNDCQLFILWFMRILTTQLYGQILFAIFQNVWKLKYSPFLILKERVLERVNIANHLQLIF